MEKEHLEITTRDVPKELAVNKTNIFKELVPDAKSTLRRIMLNSQSEKLSKEIATDILDRAGEGEGPRGTGNTIMITSSEVNLLIQAAKEARGEVQ